MTFLIILNCFLMMCHLCYGGGVENQKLSKFFKTIPKVAKQAKMKIEIKRSERGGRICPPPYGSQMMPVQH